MNSSVACSFPLGHPLPPNEVHAVSVSIPKWHDVIRYMKKDKDVVEKLQSDYPRFYEHKLVEKLNSQVLARVQAPEYTRCVIFPSEAGMKRCGQHLRKSREKECPFQELSFESVQGSRPETAAWARFSALLFPKDYSNEVRENLIFTGDGMSSRHAEFCIQNFALMQSTSVFPALQTTATRTVKNGTPAPSWAQSDVRVKEKIKARVAELVTSHKPEYDPVNVHDVMLYPKGMCAIGEVARALVPRSAISSEAIVFGWPYGSTPEAVRRGGYNRFTFFSQGSSDDLDRLESSLSSGRAIACLFCEIPSNPLCATPDLRRIRDLADRHGFVVVCDDTIGTSVNVDLLPYADIIITSLTKMFSGACNVMGGSVVLNSRSPLYDMFRTSLQQTFEDFLFPLDAEVLHQNCLDFPSRVRKANSNALAVVKVLRAAGDIISHVNYPTIVSSKALYENCRRPNGGYGYLLSFVLRRPEHTMRLYDEIDLWKGFSCGANYTLVLPYSQVVHASELDWAESQGMSKHIVRISVGIEEENLLITKLREALEGIRAMEHKSDCR